MTAGFVTEHFDPRRHDRESFSSGVSQVDNFFRYTAGKLAKVDNIRLVIMTDSHDAVIGFHATNAHSSSFAELPKQFARSRPGHGHIPAAFISMMGIDARYAGRGFGRFLMLDALSRIASASENLGIAMVMLDVLDCGDPLRVERRRTFYLRFGFVELPQVQLRMFMPIATLRDLVGKPAV